jgi:hypothetical protein
MSLEHAHYTECQILQLHYATWQTFVNSQAQHCICCCCCATCCCLPHLFSTLSALIDILLAQLKGKNPHQNDAATGGQNMWTF